MATSVLRSALAEPRVDDAPARVWRDWVIAAAVMVGSLIEVVVRDDLSWPVASLGVAVVVSLAMFSRRRRPLLSLAVAMGVANLFGVAVWLVEDETGFLYSTAALLVLPYSLYRWGSGRDAAIGSGLLVVVWIVGITTDPGTAADAIGGLTVLALTAVLGIVVRTRASLRERGVEQIKLREREQLARELHDTVAHHVSAIAVQAQAGQAVAATRPAAAVETLAVIEDAAKRTLAEMRTLVGALRSTEQATLAPREGIADIARLVADSSDSLAIDLEMTGDLRELNPLVDAAVYRIAQESITNALRHARGATQLSVRVTALPDRVELTVTDDGDRPSVSVTDGDGPGFGVLGMSERAILLGGTLSAGWCNDGGWKVAAELPRSAASRHGVDA